MSGRAGKRFLSCVDLGCEAPRLYSNLSVFGMTRDLKSVPLLIGYFGFKFVSRFVPNLAFLPSVHVNASLRYIILLKTLYCLRSDQISRSVVSDSLRPLESQHARPPCPSPTPRVH